ncbi:MAG: hypothetical protein AYK19_18285 [Theionarchaea archaeon DG-70-1]|nr:MAG: hypothetical protein AYK19_18285 [Theionarchaea archaeon DG-70-1]
MHKLRLFLVSMLLVLPLQGQGEVYRVTFEGEGLAPIDTISLSASSDSLYMAYTPPDTVDTVVVELSPELSELASMRIEGLVSPCVKVYNNNVYLAGIQGEKIVIRVYSGDLEFVEDFEIAVEEPTHVYILPYKEGILLSYVHRFLEDGLLRQDVFVKKVDFSFNEIGEARLTGWDFWQDPCIAVYGDNIIVSYANAPLYGFLDRHAVVALLSKDLEGVGMIRYPKDAAEGRNVTQPEIAVLDDGIVLFCRVTDQSFSYSKFTWEGMVTVLPGNIRAVKLKDDLVVEKEVFITEDFTEEYAPSAVSAFGRIYFAYCVSEKTGKSLEVFYADTLEGLTVEPPQEWPYWVVIPVAIVLVVLAVLVKKRSKAKKEKKTQKRK